MARGGARPGAGRKAKADNHAGAIARAEGRCADRLPTSLDEMEELAAGASQVAEVYQPAALVLVDVPALGPAGEQLYDARGRPLTVKRPAYPDKPGDELVLVDRKVTRFPPDYHAIAYLIDRIMGKAKERKELSGPEGGAIPLSIEAAIAKVYGRPKGPEPGPAAP